MPALTPSFLFDLESNMQLISSNEYARLASGLWWPTVAKEKTSKSKKERITWLLETASIERTAKGGGQAKFDDIVAQSTEIENENAAAGLKLKKEQLDDLDGNGIQLATHWSRQMGAYAAYWPQQAVAEAIRANPTAYDAKAFFASDHPVNPFDSGVGTYANVFTGASSGIYPGALKIDVSVSLETAIENLAKAIAYIASILMPSGTAPRMLRPSALIVPPALQSRAIQLTSAKFIAQDSAGGGGGSADVEAVIQNFGFGRPVVAPELSSAFSGGSDSTFYMAMESIATDELGAFIYQNREPFSVNYHGPMSDAELARKREFEWTLEGRNTAAPGHPFLLFQVKAS